MDYKGLSANIQHPLLKPVVKEDLYIKRMVFISESNKKINFKITIDTKLNI